jgi:hypothetical protein
MQLLERKDAVQLVEMYIADDIKATDAQIESLVEFAERHQVQFMRNNFQLASPYSFQGRWFRLYDALKDDWVKTFPNLAKRTDEQCENVFTRVENAIYDIFSKQYRIKINILDQR